MDVQNQPFENTSETENNTNSAIPNTNQTEIEAQLENSFREIIKEKDDKIAKLSAEIAEHKDKYLRLFADFDNFRRRTAKERLDLINTAGKDVILSFLEILDDLDRAEKIMQDQNLDLDSQKEGVKLI
ncbi:MAG: nucleotide exchange factor GrpE, partial [Sediminibacterium sp.]|nr:nucleotide exchange factor GrpE [Sediminibacterium sp.]